MHRTLWLVFALLGLGVAAWLTFGGGAAERPLGDQPLAGLDQEPVGEPVETRVTADGLTPRDAVERREIELAQELGMIDSADLDARARLVLRGRVVDSGGGPIANALVTPSVRRSARAMFERGRPDAQNIDWRALFRDRPLSKPTSTAADGSFEFSGDAFRRGASIRLEIQHEGFAPAVVRREWMPEDGDVELPDVVLGAGATVVGMVIGPTGTPVPDAAVAFVDRNAGRGGGGPGRGRGGGPFGGDQGVRELVGEAQSDAAGRFVLEHVPAGRFRLTASAPSHVDGRSGEAEAVDGADVDVGAIELGPGAILSGVVLNFTGAPVVDAEVTAMVSRNQGAGSDARRQGGRGQGGFGRAGGARQSTTTDTDGRFTLDRVPRQPLRVEVRHPEYVDEDVDPINPVAQAEMRVQLRESPTARGVVVDARTGEPIETFGIRARPMPRGGFGGFGGGGRRGGRGMDIAERLANASPEMADRILEMQARTEREETWRKQQIGGSGIVPSRTPEPGAHPEGRFELADLQPGDFVFDVDAPGYVKLAAGPFSIAANASNDGLVVPMERGFALVGRVVDGRSDEPVGGARVALAIRPLEDSGTQNNPMAAFGGFGRRGGGRGPMGGGRDQLDQARTDSSGYFSLRPMRAGSYLLTVEADSYPGLRDPAYVLGAASDGVVLRLDPGARVHGIVFGVPEGERTRLEFSHAETSETRRATVSREDGSYEVSGLVAGGWFVRVLDSSGGGRGGRGADMIGRIGAAVAARSGAAPDVIVPPGGDVRYDVGIDSLQLGTVRGRVFRNGGPGDGLEVRLVTVGVTEGVDPRIERFMRGRLGQLWSGRVNAEDGTYEIERVPPGQYRLEVHPRSGGRGGFGGRGGGPQLNQGSALHAEPLSIRKAEVAERTIEVNLGALELTIQAVGGEAVPRGRASIVLAVDAGDSVPDTWSSLPSFQRLGLRDGRVESKLVRPGAYRYAIEARGFRTVTGTIQVPAGDEPARANVPIEVDPNAPADAGNASGAGGPGGPGGRGN